MTARELIKFLLNGNLDAKIIVQSKPLEYRDISVCIDKIIIKNRKDDNNE